MTRLDELTQSIRADRTKRSSAGGGKRAARLRAQGHATGRPGDRLHRALVGPAGDIRPGDAEQLEELLSAIKAHKGDVPAIAAELGVGERTLRRWMGAFTVIRTAVEIAQLEARLARLGAG
jgi:hypothetical protein